MTPARPLPPPRVGCRRTMDRRHFLEEAAVAAATILVALGATPDVVAARVAEVAAIGEASDVARYPLPSCDGAAVDAEHGVLLVRWLGQVHAFSLYCPHRAVPLEWRATEQRAFCPKHEAWFQPDGSWDHGFLTRALDRHALTRESEELLVDLERRIRADQEPEAWREAVVRVEAAVG
ncbi:MAG TPA: Rieske 2Fe-2S domain-containing protein [Gemmatimonadaceae bacterium]|nr:Rieske 2Fe-2S domain-containing protein [Gemmatimonadaceae bacterium]